jgi:hypothetical protein
MTNLTILKPEHRTPLAAKVRDRPSDIGTAFSGKWRFEPFELFEPTYGYVIAECGRRRRTRRAPAVGKK